MDICIIGYGVVGQSIAKLFRIKKYFDLKESTINLEQAAKCKFCFITLPTPVDPDGNYLTQDIEAIIKQIEDYGGAGIYIMKSTVPPGFAHNLMNRLGIDRIVSNPEFLSEDTVDQDTKNPPFILIGGISARFMDDVKALYQSRVKGANFILTDNSTAELAKLALNAYFSTKVIFANGLYEICQKLGTNYERIKQVMEKHPFGPRNHFTIWYKGKRGVNGKCLPKDTKAFNRYTGMELTRMAMNLNAEYIGETQ